MKAKIIRGVFLSICFLGCKQMCFSQTLEWQALGNGLDKNSFELKVYKDDLYVCGNGISKWDGQSWTFLPTVPGGFVVRSIAFFRDTLYAGGYFDNIYRLEGNNWAQVGADLKGQKIIYDLHADQNGIILRGAFDSIGSVPFPGIAEWNGSSWQNVRGGLSGSISSFLNHDGELLASGDLDFNGNTGDNKSIITWDINEWKPYFLNDTVESAGRLIGHKNGFLIRNAKIDTGQGNITGLVNFTDGKFYSISSNDTFIPRNFAVVDTVIYAYGLHHPSLNTWDYRVSYFDNGNWIQVGEYLDGYAIDMLNYKNTVVACGSFANSGSIHTGNVAQLRPYYLSINNFEKKTAWSVYPNPTQKNFYLSGLAFSSVELFDLNGNLIESFSGTNLDLSGLSKGIYFLKILGNGGEQEVKKIIKF
jgi:hypothetical protein